MPDRYPGYDVLDKRNTPSWNEPSRQVIDKRLAIVNEPLFFSAREWLTLTAVCDRIVPQPGHRIAVPIAAMVDRKMLDNDLDGFRRANMPRMQEAWRSGLAALVIVAGARYDKAFHALDTRRQDLLLEAMQKGELDGPEWGGMPSALFFSQRLCSDILSAYYSHPAAWNEIGFGGPASPRGYVRLDANRRDPWEAAEATPGYERSARRKNEHVGRSPPHTAW